MGRLRGTALTTAGMLAIALASLPQAQGTPPPAPLTLVAPEGRRPIPTIVVGGQELVALDEVAALFQLAVREDPLAGGLALSYRGRTILVSPNRPFASVDGRIVNLPSPLVRIGQRWMVPVEFIPRAVAPVYDQPVDLRRPSRLLIVGPVRAPRVTGRVEASGPPTRATLDISPPAPVSPVVDGSRVLVRIEADVLDASLPQRGAGLVDQMQADSGTTVVIALAPGAGPPRVVTTPGDAVTRVLIEVPPALPGENAPVSAPPIEPPVPGRRAALATVAIDPGHGGEDVGARGPAGTEEKLITLAIAQRLRTRIETRLGVRVVLTRDDDRAISQDARAAIANNSKADLFLSLHANAAPAGTRAGAEVIFLRLDREGEHARRMAMADQTVLPVLGGGMRAIDVLPWELAQAGHVDDSAVLATQIERELRRRVVMSPLGLHQAPLRVLVGANMPAALVEVGYLTHGAQESQLQTDEYQNDLADALFEGILRFREHLEGRRRR